MALYMRTCINGLRAGKTLITWGLPWLRTLQRVHTGVSRLNKSSAVSDPKIWNAAGADTVGTLLFKKY